MEGRLLRRATRDRMRHSSVASNPACKRPVRIRWEFGQGMLVHRSGHRCWARMPAPVRAAHGPRQGEGRSPCPSISPSTRRTSVAAFAQACTAGDTAALSKLLRLDRGLTRERVAGGSTGLHVEHGRGSIRRGSVFSVLWRATVQHPGHQRADVDLLAAGVARACLLYTSPSPRDS